MQTKPTPAPWIIESSRAEDMPFWLIKADQPIILHSESAESEANAYLIAAAPALLEACQLARTYLGNMESVDGNVRIAMELLDNAIKKAQGQ